MYDAQLGGHFGQVEDMCNRETVRAADAAQARAVARQVYQGRAVGAAKIPVRQFVHFEQASARAGLCEYSVQRAIACQEVFGGTATIRGVTARDLGQHVTKDRGVLPLCALLPTHAAADQFLGIRQVLSLQIPIAGLDQAAVLAAELWAAAFAGVAVGDVAGAWINRHGRQRRIGAVPRAVREIAQDLPMHMRFDRAVQPPKVERKRARSNAKFFDGATLYCADRLIGLPVQS